MKCDDCNEKGAKVWLLFAVIFDNERAEICFKTVRNAVFKTII